MNGVLRNIILTGALTTAVTGAIPLLPAQPANAIVKVQQVNSDTPGDGSIVINQAGAIYVY
jgi:hypothetical protein